MHLRVYSMILLFMAISIEATDQKKVLIYNPYIGYHHINFMTTIANELAFAGHEVTMLDSLINQSREKPVRESQIKVVTVKQNAETRKTIENGDSDSGLKAFWDDVSWINKFMGLFSYYLDSNAAFSRMVSPQCKDVVNSDQLEQLRKTEFDLAITEVFDLCGVGIFDILQPKRVILASSVPLHEYLGEMLGLPKTFDVVPTKFRLNTMTLLQEGFKAFGIGEVIDNAMSSALWGQNIFGYLEAAEYKIFKEHNSSFPGFKDLLKRAHSLIENVHPLLDLSKPTLNSIIPIGGITIDKRSKEDFEKANADDLKKIAEELKEAKDKKKVLVSFGTVMNSTLMSSDIKKNLMKALEDVQDVVFFWNGDDKLLQGITVPSNVKIHTWLPQNYLLASGEMDLFVSHMGIGSFTEAAYSGVPLVSVPIFVDQHYNYLCAKRLGITRFVDKSTLSSSSKPLTDAIYAALKDKHSIGNSTQLKANLVGFGDQRKKMIDHINFILSLPANSTSMAFHNYHDGFSFKLSITSLAHLAPIYAVHIVVFVLWITFCVVASLFFWVQEMWKMKQDKKKKDEENKNGKKKNGGKKNEKKKSEENKNGGKKNNGLPMKNQNETEDMTGKESKKAEDRSIFLRVILAYFVLYSVLHSISFNIPILAILICTSLAIIRYLNYSAMECLEDVTKFTTIALFFCASLSSFPFAFPFCVSFLLSL